MWEIEKKKKEKGERKKAGVKICLVIQIFSNSHSIIEEVLRVIKYLLWNPPYIYTSQCPKPLFGTWGGVRIIIRIIHLTDDINKVIN